LSGRLFIGNIFIATDSCKTRVLRVKLTDIVIVADLRENSGRKDQFIKPACQGIKQHAMLGERRNKTDTKRFHC
jgi:hypothetical protein